MAKKKSTKKIKRIAVLTSGGDAAGMNACIRSVVRCGIYNGLDVYGIKRGYTGLIEADIEKMELRSVSNIMTRGGTVLKTTRCPEFTTKSGRKKAADALKKNNIDGLIVVGGNGSFRGAHMFYKEHKIPVIGVPGTIDNDIQGSDYTIGADTAVNVALDAMDKIRDTVSSMERIYVVEVMGREEPFIAIRVGLAGGAEDVLFPYTEYDIDRMCDDIKAGRKKGKISWIIVVAEGVAKASDVTKLIIEATGYEVRSVALGHVQRGGSPTAFDRILASRLGAWAVDLLIKGQTDKMAGVQADELVAVDLVYSCEQSLKKAKLNKELYNLTRILAT